MQGVSALGANRVTRQGEGAEGLSSSGHLAEVWGDVVDLRHLGAAIVIGAVVSLGAYLAAGRIFSAFIATPEVGRAYAMLVGLVGCVAAGAICARLFPAKREIIETVDDPAWRAEALEHLASEAGSLGSVADLPPAAVAEMKELGIYELFSASQASAGGMESRPSSETEHRLAPQGA